MRAFDGTLQLQGPFELIVTIFLDADINDQAYIFSIINTTQSKLDPSLFHELSELSKITTPENVVHSIAKVFNSEIDGPWYQCIKRLGRKDQTSINGIISQYSFNKAILRYIYDKKQMFQIRNILIKNNDQREKLKELKVNKEQYVLWDYYINYQENILYKILNSYFNALREVFNSKWCKDESILCKTSGYDAFMKLFKDFYLYANGNNETLINTSFYVNILNTYYRDQIDIDDAANKLGAAGASNLYKQLKEKFPVK